MAFVQPQRIVSYERYCHDDPILMSVPCKVGDPISVNATGYGVLADATDLTAPCHGFASKEVTAADIAASYTAFVAGTVFPNTPAYDRGLVTLFEECILRPSGGEASVGTAQTRGARVYLVATATAGAGMTVTQPTADTGAVQRLGRITADGLGVIAEVSDMFQYVNSTTAVNLAY